MARSNSTSEQPQFTEEYLQHIISEKTPVPAPADLRESLKDYISEVVVLIQTIKDEELLAALNHLNSPLAGGDTNKPISWYDRDISLTLGIFADHKAAIIQTRKGVDCQHELMPALHYLPNVKLVIGLGFAYARRNKCNLGDVIISTYVDGVGNCRIEDGRLRFDEGCTRYTPVSTRTGNIFTKGTSLWITFTCSTDGRKSKAHAGVLISSPMLLNDQRALDEYLRNNDRFIGGEMEGQELAHAQFYFKEKEDRQVDFIIIKGVADFGDGTKEKAWQLTASLAAASYAERKLRDTQGTVYSVEKLRRKYLHEKSTAKQTLTDALEDSGAVNDAPPSKRICINTDINVLGQNNTPPIALAPSNSASPQTIPHWSPIDIFAEYLRSLYRSRKLPAYGKWPPTPSKQFINLAVILKEKVSRASADNFTKATLRGKSDDILQKKKRIQFSDLAKTKDGEPAQLVLVEGAPGIGKSTFAWEACRKWGAGEILQRYKLVVLLRLREKRVQQAKNTVELFHYTRSADVKQKVVEEIENSDGTGVLLVLEGFDELPAQLRKESSLFMDIIKGERLTKATILITSRHWASRPLLLNDELHRPLSQHIEILGFTRKDIEDYLQCMTFDDPSVLPGLQEYLSYYPNIASMMYVPLNCAIVLEVYRQSRSDVNQLIPKTMTELYTSLVRTLLIRYLHDQPEYGDKYKRLSNFHNLPEPVYKQFRELARIAYEGICNDEQIIFSDLSDGFETLGLMQCVPELYVDQGAVVSYNFLHLTLQEFLAAYHVSLMPGDIQMEHFFKAADSMMMEFTAGLTKLEFTEDEVAQFSRFLDNGEVRHPSLFYWLFEAQNANLLQTISNNSEIIKFDSSFLRTGSRGPFDFYILGYCVSHSNCKWDMTMAEVDYEEARLFVRGTDNYSMHCGKIVSMYASCTDLKLVPFTTLPPCLLTELIDFSTVADDGWNNLAKLVLNTPQLRKLNLECSTFPPGSAIQLFDSLCSLHSLITLNVSGDEGMDLSPEDCQALGRLLSTSKSLTELYISELQLVDPGIEYIINGLKQSTLQRLDIFYCAVGSNGAYHIANALCDNSSLRDFILKGIEIEDQGASAVAEMLTINHSLKALYMQQCGITELGAIKLAEALGINSTLTNIDLSHNSIKDQGASAVAQMLTRNQTLKALYMQQCGITELGAIKLAEALGINSTLTNVNLSHNSIKDQGASAVAQMLTRKCSLKELNVRYCSITGVGANHLARALLTNHSITHMWLGGNASPSGISIDPRLMRV